jgi:hypothetical protein
LGRYCFVCASAHKVEYNKLRSEGMQVRKVMDYAHATYPEDMHLKYYHFQKHFQNDLDLIVNEQVNNSKLREKIVTEAIKKDIEIAKRLTANLEIIDDRMEALANKELLLKEDQELLLKYMGESRLIIEQFLKWSSKLEIKSDDTDTFTKIMKCIEDFPPDLIAKFAERWKDYGK